MGIIVSGRDSTRLLVKDNHTDKTINQKDMMYDNETLDDIDDKIVDLKNMTSGGGQENQDEKIAEKDKEGSSDDAAMKIGNSCLVEVKLTDWILL